MSKAILWRKDMQLFQKTFQDIVSCCSRPWPMSTGYSLNAAKARLSLHWVRMKNWQMPGNGNKKEILA